jgi:hypothetical protein
MKTGVSTPLRLRESAKHPSASRFHDLSILALLKKVYFTTKTQSRKEKIDFMFKK